MRISDWSSDVCSSDLPCFLQFDLPVIKEGEAASTPRMTCAPVSRGVPAMQGRRLNIQQGLWQLCTKMPRSAKIPRCCVFDLAAGAKALPFGNDKIGRASCRERVCQYV